MRTIKIKRDGVNKIKLMCNFIKNFPIIILLDDNKYQLEDVLGDYEATYSIDGKIKCADCGELLTADNAWWAFGKWWHRLVDECNKYRGGKK